MPDKDRTKLNAAQRERYQNDPEYRAKKKAYRSAYHREHHQNDPEYRTKAAARAKAPLVRAKRNAAQRERYQNDPEYRAKKRTYMREKRESRLSVILAHVLQNHIENRDRPHRIR